MIFLTIGTQLPFDRLTQALDEVAPQINEPIFGQIGKSAKYRPQNFDSVDLLSPEDFGTRFANARVIVGHAGIGTILSGLKSQKPLLLMARRAAFGEHRNDHQLATCAQMKRLPGLHIAETAQDIFSYLSNPALQPMQANSQNTAKSRLLEAIRRDIGLSLRT
ncbi:glycosyltransferase [Phaeovulum sp. W22_SRMD_FR3]|uniref:glycosyltransferase n=1 Tax=Phaeovulum sp. W22_SRMD_FR3 TaxID=3240274 RepID=UPI003F9932CF